MSWNHKSQIVAIAVAIQTVPGVFTQPNTTTDLIAVSQPTNTRDPITTEDPTATGTIWTQRRMYLGKVGTVSGTFPLRGPGGASPPAANAWPFGRIMQSGGFTEQILAAALTNTTQAGSTTTAVRLHAAASAVDDAYFGMPLQMAALGTGFRQNTLIMDYLGATKDALIPETIVAPGTGVNFTIPANLTYVLGTLTGAPPLLSVSVWRHKLRYDYKDVRPTSLGFSIPVSNEYNQEFPSVEFALKGKLEAIVQENSPALPDSIMNVPIPPAKGGKFVLDRVPLGHGSMRWTNTTDVGAPSNQNQDEGQDAYEFMTGSRVANFDLNQMDLSDFDFNAREDNQTIMPALSTWGMGTMNRFGLVTPGVVIDPLNIGDRNGFVSLTGDAFPTALDKSVALSIW